MLMQLHWQFKDGHTEMQLQREINSVNEFRLWVMDAWESHPPPEGAVWLACDEKSEHFVHAPAGGANGA